MTTSFAAALPGLSPREAIKDALYRSVNALDTADATLFDSAFTNDATFDLNGKIVQSLGNLRTSVYDLVADLDTTHFITNERVTHDASTAKLTATALAQHYRPGEGLKLDAQRLLTGSLYWLDLVKDDASGLWKIKSFVMKSTWMEGTYDVFKS